MNHTDEQRDAAISSILDSLATLAGECTHLDPRLQHLKPRKPQRASWSYLEGAIEAWNSEPSRVEGEQKDDSDVDAAGMYKPYTADELMHFYEGPEETPLAKNPSRRSNKELAKDLRALATIAAEGFVGDREHRSNLFREAAEALESEPVVTDDMAIALFSRLDLGGVRSIAQWRGALEAALQVRT